MTNYVLACILLFTLSVVSKSQTGRYQQVGSTVTCGNVRFEFLTPSMGRMEYSPGRQFEDNPTVVVTRRDFPVCKVDVKEYGDWLTMRTERITLKYLLGSGKFTPENTVLAWIDSSGKHSWKPGDVDSANLGGVSYSLDGARKNKLPQFSPGILSRNGYFVLDDSKSPAWIDSTGWIAPRSGPDNQDFYWIVYGNDYARALKEYSELAGKIPMIPRYSLGTWITDLNYEYLSGSEVVDRYHYTDNDVRTMVERFRKEGIPLDVLVLDFAWHKFGWQGGYDWSPIFPDPKSFLDWAHGAGLKVSLNDHPGYAKEGVLSASDSHAENVIRKLNITQPPEPTYNIDLSKNWKFRTDVENAGIRERWFSQDYSDSSWGSMNAGVIWESQGFPNYDGVGWYRKSIQYPAGADGAPVLIVFGGVDDEYDLFINGKKVAHYGAPGSSIWSSLTSTDVTNLLHKGAENLIALRVNDWGGGGGISKGPIELTDHLPFEGIRFNLADKKQAGVFMEDLHNPLVDQGVDFWWIDGGKGSCEMNGLDGQMWTNRVFYDFTQKHTGKRAFVFSRYGGWGNHRYPSIFTGDTYSDWDVLGYEVKYSAESGNVLMPYVTHDIGGFLGRKIPFDLYVRWIQFGVFNPLLRLHSAFENPKDGNLRMPWMYGEDGVNMVRTYFDLRYQLLPYIYSYSRVAYDAALPLNRPLYLEYPNLNDAYKHPDEYFFGREFLCAPIVDSSGERDVYLPPGAWFDFFSDKLVSGDKTIHVRHSLRTFPLFVRDGSIIPTRPNLQYSEQHPLDTLFVRVYGLNQAKFELYEDDGISLEYESGASSRTTISSAPGRKGEQEIVVGPTTGEFRGQPTARAYTFELRGFRSPRNVRLNGQNLPLGGIDPEHWEWDAQKSLLRIRLNSRNIRSRISLIVR